MTVAELAKKLRKLGEETATNFQGWKSVATSPKLRTEFVNQGVKPLVSSAVRNAGNKVGNIPALTTNQNIRRPFGDVLQQSAGQILQRTPNLPTPRTKLSKVNLGISALTNPIGTLATRVAPNMGAEMLRSYGRTLDRTATPEGRKQLYQTPQRIKQIGFKPAKILADPGVEDVLNLADIIPVGKIAGAGLKTAGKGVKALNAVGNMAGFARIPGKADEAAEGIEALMKEARKYKSAEEFVRAQGVGEGVKQVTSKVNDIAGIKKYVGDLEKSLVDAVSINDNAAIKNITTELNNISSTYKIPVPKLEDIRRSISKESALEEAAMLKEFNAEMRRQSGRWGDYETVVNKMVDLLKRRGESVSDTGELLKEHIPSNIFGISSDEIATDLGMYERDFLDELAQLAGAMGGDRAAAAKLSKSQSPVGKAASKVKWDLAKLIEKKTPGIKPIITKPLDELIGVTAEPTQQTLAKMAEKKIKIVEKANRLAQPRSPTIGDITGMIKKSTVSPIAKEVDQYKDIGNLAKGFKDVYRNFETVFGKAFPKVKAQILDPFDASKGKFIDMQVDLAEDLEKNVIKRLGINKGSKLSELVQRFGEGKMTLEDLQKEAPKDWQNVIEADKWFRGKYDELLNQVNSVRARIYPGQPDKIIPKRQDYYRHFQDFTDGFRGILKIFDSPANISSDLVGKSEFTKPKSKWLSFAQRRLGDYTDQDAVGGFLNYLKAASYATHIDQHIPRFRALADELASATLPDSKSAGKLNNFIDYLQEFSNQLSGKTGVLERPIQRFIPGGRKTMSLLNALNSRVKANVIVGNLSSAVAQAFNVPQGIADAGVDNFAKGLGRSFADIFEPQKVMKQSNFLKERYAGDIYSKFDKDLLSKPRQMAVWTTQVLDEVGTKLIWNAEYEKALKIGTPNPVKYADDFTRKMVGGRGIGEVPLIQQDRFFQLIAPFQLEVGNTLSVMGDWASNKQLGKLATFFIASHLFNRTAKAIRGSDVSFDPIQASLEAMDAYIEEEDKATGVMRAGGRLAGEVLSNVPLGQTAASVYPEYGFKIGERQMPTRKDLFGEGDPTRFGGGLLVSKGLQDPLFKVIPSFGGQQLKRTIEGLSSYNRGYSETDSGKVRYPINQGVGNFLKTATFGEYSTPEARKYFDSGATPLGENQSEIFKQKGTDYYNKIMNIRDSKKNPQKEQGSVLEGWLDTNRSVGAAGSLPTDDTEVLYLYEGALSSLGKYGDNKLKANYGLADKTLEEYQMEADEALEMKRLVEKERPDIARFVKTKEKDSRDYALNENKKQRAKKDEDYKTWLDLAKKQLEILDRQMQDPTLDEVALSNLEEKAANLIDEITKYEGYGGSFKKGKKITIKDTNLKIAKPESRAVKVTATKKPDLDIDIKAPTFKMSTPPLTNIQDKFIIKQSPAKKFKIKRKQISVKLGK